VFFDKIVTALLGAMAIVVDANLVATFKGELPTASEVGIFNDSNASFYPNRTTDVKLP
jgi:hypothetical protein